MELKTIGVVSQLVAEIAIASRCSRRYDGYTLAERRDRELLVEVYHAFLSEYADNLLTTASHIAKSEGGVYLVHYPRESESLVKAGMHPHQHLHA